MMHDEFQAFRDFCRNNLMLVEEVITEVVRLFLQGRDGFSVIDGGAHHGYHTSRCAALDGCKRVYAVEADPHTVQTLRARLARLPQHINEKITVIESALQDSHSVTEISFMSSVSHPGRSGVASIWKDDPNVEFRENVRVSATTIDNIAEHTEGAVAFIKLDLEGGDYMALRGAVKVLTEFRPLCVFENSIRAPKIYGYECADVLNFFRGIDYELVSFSGNTIGVENFFEFWEAWAVPNNRAPELKSLISQARRDCFARYRGQA